MSAVQFDSYDSAFTNVTVNYSGGAVLDSPYSAFEFVSGSGNGYAVTGVNISNVKVQNLGTVVMQAETTGSASVTGVTSSGVGVAGAYNDSYPGNVAGAYTFNLGSGNSGWSTTRVLTAFPEPAQPGSLTVSPTSLSFGDVSSGSTSAAQSVTVTNPGSSAASVSSISTTGPFSQTSNCGGSIAAGGSCTVQAKFAPTGGGPQTGTLSVASNAPGSPLTVALSGTGVISTTNLALNQPVTASSDYQTYTPRNAVDGNTSTYWESIDGASYPQWITVDLGSVQSIGSITLDLPPSSAWNTRTETLSVLDSTSNSTFTQIVASAGYTFNPATGNTVTVSLPAGTSTRYVQLNFTGNTGWGAAQLSEFEIFPGGGTNGSALTASPSSVSFGSVTVGQTSSAQTVATNPVVYLDFWGSQWDSDPNGVQQYMQNLFSGLGDGSDSWSTTMSQYTDGSGNPVTFGGSVLGGTWVDNASAAPQSAAQADLAAEAQNAAAHFGVSGPDVDIFVVSPSGTSPDGFPNTGFCAWHDWNGTTGYTNMPYVLDAGSSCGANSVQNQLDGFSIVGGHEYAEAVTDPEPSSGWVDQSNGEEIGDLCAWTNLQAITFDTGSFAMQPLWSDNDNGCVQ